MIFPCPNLNINSGIVQVPKKGDLTICTNYRGIRFSQIAAKVYNRMNLKINRPVIESLFCPTYSGFRPSRSTSSHVLALRIIAVEVRNHKKVALIIFIDFKHISILNSALYNLWYCCMEPSCSNKPGYINYLTEMALQLIHFAPYRSHAFRLFFNTTSQLALLRLMFCTILFRQTFPTYFFIQH